MRSRPLLVAAVVVLLAAGAGAAAWALVLRGDQVAPLALPATSPGASTAAAATSSASGSSPAGGLPAAASAAVDAASVPGTWTVAADSVVGYRVRERLASLPADSDAVGRTSSITGTAIIAVSGGALSVTAGQFRVDMTTLASDRRMRDNRLRNDGIQTDAFPTAAFELTAPVALPASATAGTRFDVTLHGDLTLHGLTKAVDIAAQAQLDGTIVRVAGSLTFPFSDFSIHAPDIAGFVTVEDHGTLEFLVDFVKA